MAYRLLRFVARIALRWYYRSIEVTGREHIPATGAVILAANHNNALVDALIVASSIDREVRLTAKATLLDNPLTRVIVHTVGIVPLRRTADEPLATGTVSGAARNTGAFEAIVGTLASGGVLLIFPEGLSHSAPELAPLKTGCARMALEAASEGVESLRIIPVGITFEDKGRPRTRVAVHVGTPIVVGHSAPSADQVAALTSALDAGLRAVTLNFPTIDDAERVLHVSHTLIRVLADVRPLAEPQPPLGHTVQLARQIEDVRRRLPLLDADLLERVQGFVADLDRWRATAQMLRAPLGDVAMPLSRASGAWFLVREVTIGLIAAPVAMWGRLNHWLPVRAALVLARLTSRNPDEPAMHALVGGTGLVVASYTIAAGVAFHALGWPWSVVYLASLPVAARVDFWWSDRLRAAIRRARGYLKLRANPEQARWLVMEQQRLRTESHSLTSVLT